MMAVGPVGWAALEVAAGCVTRVWAGEIETASSMAAARERVLQEDGMVLL
jgi:hypothetical protein